MSITFIGEAHNPADNAALATTGAGVQPHLNLFLTPNAGDLVICGAVSRENSATRRNDLDIAGGTQLGGQLWTQFGTGNDHSSATSGDIRTAYCKFNGTWVTGGTDDLAFQMNASTANTANSTWMLVFRSSAGNGVSWGVDVAEQATTYAAPGSPFTTTRAGQTSGAPSTVSLAVVTSEGANTWSTLAGAGWTLAGGNTQWRNTQGSGLSYWLAYNIQTSPGATGSVSQNSSAGSPGWTEIVTFSELFASDVNWKTNSRGVGNGISRGVN